MKAKKENKIYQINEEMKKRYLEEGYDIYSDAGELLEHSPKKKITFAEHEKAMKDLKDELEATSGNGNSGASDVVEMLKSYAALLGADIGNATSVNGIVKKIKEFKPEGGA